MKIGLVLAVSIAPVWAADDLLQYFVGRWVLEHSIERCGGKEVPPIKSSEIVLSISDGWLKRSGFTTSDDENDHYTDFEAKPDGKEYKIVSYLEKNGQKAQRENQRFVRVLIRFPSIEITITDGVRVRSEMGCDLTLDRKLNCRSSGTQSDGKGCGYLRTYGRKP